MNGQPERPDTDIEDDDAIVEAEDGGETARTKRPARRRGRHWRRRKEWSADSRRSTPASAKMRQ